MSWCLQSTYDIKATSISVAALFTVVYTECWVVLYPHKRLRERLGLSLLHFAPRWLIGSSRIDHRDSGPRSETMLTYKPIFLSLIYWWFSTSFNSRDIIVHPVTPWLFHNIFEATTEEWTSAPVDDFQFQMLRNMSEVFRLRWTLSTLSFLSILARSISFLFRWMWPNFIPLI